MSRSAGSAELREAGARAEASAPDYHARVRALLDLGALVAAGWDAAVAVLSPSPDHPQLGWTPCRRCGRQAASTGLCRRCAGHGSPVRLEHQPLCIVCRTPGHERPADSNGLCKTCASAARTLGLTAEQYRAGTPDHPAAQPRPSFGHCMAAVCEYWAWTEDGLCKRHRRRWLADGRPEIGDWARWAEPVVGTRGGKIHLGGLPDLVRDELLLGVQLAGRHGRHWPPTVIRPAVDAIRRARAPRLAAIDVDPLRTGTRQFLVGVQESIALALGDREREVLGDVWDLRLWGLPGYLRFDGSGQPLRADYSRTPALIQPWLKAAAKHVAELTLARVDSRAVPDVMTQACALWSQWLLRRADQGMDPAALGKSDIAGFIASLGVGARAGELSEHKRAVMTRGIRTFLRQVHETNLTAPGGPCAGLPATVSLSRHDLPRRQQRDPEDNVGAALPAAVIAQLLDPRALAALPSVAAARRVRIALDVGRRPGEMVRLRWDCLTYDETADPATGAVTRLPVLVHDMPKVKKVGYRLPITQNTADLITEQQAEVRATYPATPAGKLALWPQRAKNRDGARPMTAAAWARELRLWVAGLDLVDGRLDPDGKVIPRTDAVGVPAPFPAEAVTPYSFRHTWAQRHIDAGTPVQDLKDLLGHSKITSTQAYYRINTERRRAAVARIAGLQMTAGGSLTLPVRATDSAVSRYSVGQVAVPFGVCTEPSNVRAQGQSCQFRHRCFGCVHFRTDPSYLPELRAYLGEMLFARERLSAALPELTEWARAEALPHEQEIATVRHLIAASEAVLSCLPYSERADVEDAIEVLRDARRNLDARFPAQFRHLAAQPHPVLFPNIRRRHETESAHDDSA